ncbi:MAG: hypothetical protein DI536_28815 [Archangium gephyra]|uniref:Uncharacterized protein n=1 Tax=Archangium gephyra TaxID=48 RepID=A0A2W5VA69_9BACT|nr:MAG: hypothetical protein DI536_28815 [Archangium gephyra]
MNHAERESRSSDPLPYVQVDRAVRTSVVAPLAGVMNVTPQHVLGSLVQWWEMCGRPADLERIVNETPAGTEPSVVLAEDTVRRRFHLASGHQVDPALLVELGLLEPAKSADDGAPMFRVRGMSRYFGPIKRRLQAREAAKLGGRARASAAREGGRFASKAPETRVSAPQPNHQPNASRPPADAPPGVQPSDQHSGQRSADRSTSLSYESDVGADAPRSAAPGPEVPLVDEQTAPDVAEGARGFWSAFQELRKRALGAVREKEPHPRSLGNWWSHALSEVGGDERRLWRAAELFVVDKHWRSQGAPWAGFAGPSGQWEQFATRASIKPATNPNVYSDSIEVTPAGTCSVCDLELFDGHRGDRSPCGPRGLPLCQTHFDPLADRFGDRVFDEGFGQSPEAAEWLRAAKAGVA